MLAALYVNFFHGGQNSDTHDPGWITTDELHKRSAQREAPPPTPQEIENTRRAHLEDAYARLMEIPEAAASIREVITAPVPDFRMLVRNQEVSALIMDLYLEYLDEEDILIMYASTL